MAGKIKPARKAPYFVYLLRCRDKTLYTGITTDPRRRLLEHRAGTGGHYTRARGAAKMVYIEERPSRSAALKREAEIKSWPRSRKMALAQGGS